MNYDGVWFDLGIDPATGHMGTFADWLSRCCEISGMRDAELARRYADLRHLISSTDQRKASGNKDVSPQGSQIKSWRTGEKIPSANVAYRLGQALRDAELPVCGLDALIAGHYLVDMLGIVGSHIAIGVQRSRPLFHPLAPQIAHASLMFQKLAPRISRELTIIKMTIGVSEMDIDEFMAACAPLPVEELYPSECTELVDCGFRKWAYENENARKMLPPSFEAAISLLESKPTSEVIDRAAEILSDPYKDLMELLRFGMPTWVSRGEEPESPHKPVKDSAEADYTARDAFFDEFEATFSLPSDYAAHRRSSEYPHVDVKLCGSVYHEEGTAIDIDWLVVDSDFRGHGLDAKVVKYFQAVAKKYGLTLVTWPADDADGRLYRSCGFKLCSHPLIGLGRRLEWPKCAH